MQGTSKSYEVSGETTEWEDILIKKRIITKEEVLINKGLNPENVCCSSTIFKNTLHVPCRSCSF